MAEGGVYRSIYRRDGKREEKREIEEEEELYKQLEEVSLEEVSLEERVRERTKCESCVREKCPWYEVAWYERYERVRELYGRVAVFFCFLCKMFVCAECLPKHEFHEGMKVVRKESKGTREQRERERNKGKGLFKKTERMRVEAGREQRGENESDRKRERERKRREYIEKLFKKENETERTEKLFSSHRIVCDRVEVKHELDRTDCWITGLCGLENKRLVVCDNNNFCIKIFKLGSHVIQRYIRFVGSEPGFVGPYSRPYDVTEIDLKQNSFEPNLVSGSSSDISVTDRVDPDKQCLIAVTLPLKRQVVFIDLSKKPAKTQKIIHTEEQCWSIQFYDDKIFTGCRKDHHSLCYVYVYSTDGDKLNKFDIDSYCYVPYFAVVSGRVYLTDCNNKKVHKEVQCRNVEGQLISEIKIEGSRPIGISVDPDNNVYVCAWLHGKVYRLDADLTGFKSVLDQTTDYIEEPHSLCYYRDKLFISHHAWSSSLHNFVTVVRLL